MEAIYAQEVANLLIGQEISQLRSKLKLSRQALATKVGISAYAVRQLEWGCFAGSADEMLQRIKSACRQREKRNRVS